MIDPRTITGIAQGYGGCSRCGNTWNWKNGHSTPITVNSGLFPLCEECWSELTPETRLPFYEAWWAQYGSPMSPFSMDDIRRAVLTEGQELAAGGKTGE